MFDRDDSDASFAPTLADFERQLAQTPDLPAALKRDLIGADAMVPGPEGPRRLVYADYVASGRAVGCVERFMAQSVLPYYANTHTEASFCGAHTSRLREAARDRIRRAIGGNREDHALIFVGSGATGGLNRLVHLFAIRERLARSQEVVVLVGPYEHHSNLLPWRESGARVVEIAEDPEGGPDRADLARALAAVRGADLVVAAFSAASNVTGVTCDVAAITRQVKAAGARIVWDYAGGAPYLPVAMTPAPDAAIDAIVLSPHKFLGGPGASGVLALRRDAVDATRPGAPGGGTVAFVNAHVHDYLGDLESREEGGTPNILGDIRAGLVFALKAALGGDFLARRNADIRDRALRALMAVPRLNLLGGDRQNRLPIFSFTLGGRDAPFDYQGFTRALSDRYGIQMRGGCACAGPYVHRLMGIGDARSANLRARIRAGHDEDKPGFVRFNLSVLMSDDEVSFILDSLRRLAAQF